MPHRSHARIVGLGAYLPDRILTNQELEEMVETTEEWILSRTGIQERRLAREDEFPSDMGTMAAEQALQMAGITPLQIDMIIVATMTPDYVSPATANLIQAKLNASCAACMDIQAACTGFLYALSIAKAYVESNMYQRILIVATEKMSSCIDYRDRSTCILFGDGAGAAVVAREGAGLCINQVCLGAEGEGADLVMIPAGGSRHPPTHDTVSKGLHYFKMAGREVFKHAVRRMTHAIRHCLEQCDIQEEGIRWLVPHQANKRIIDALCKQLHMPNERVYETLHKYGNTSASSIPIALQELVSRYPLQARDRLLLSAFGGGLTWGAAVLTYEPFASSN